MGSLIYMRSENVQAGLLYDIDKRRPHGEYLMILVDQAQGCTASGQGVVPIFTFFIEGPAVLMCWRGASCCSDLRHSQIEIAL